MPAFNSLLLFLRRCASCPAAHGPPILHRLGHMGDLGAVGTGQVGNGSIGAFIL